jgi:hypothetical protein
MSPGIEGEGEGEPERERAEDEHDRVRGDDRPSSEDRQRHQRRPVARLDHDEGGEQGGGGGEEQDRLRGSRRG